MDEYVTDCQARSEMVKMLVLASVPEKKEFPKYWCVRKFIFSQGLNGVFGENLNEATLKVISA